MTVLAKAPVADIFANMNNTEKRRAVELEAARRTGQIAAWWFEQWTFKLADDCRFTPDFVLQRPDGSLEVEEIKGHWRDDALVKIKVFVEAFPFPTRVLVWKKDGWQVETLR